MSKTKRRRQANRRAATVHRNNIANGLEACAGCSWCLPSAAEAERLIAHGPPQRPHRFLYRHQAQPRRRTLARIRRIKKLLQEEAA